MPKTQLGIVTTSGSLQYSISCKCAHLWVKHIQKYTAISPLKHGSLQPRLIQKLIHRKIYKWIVSHPSPISPQTHWNQNFFFCLESHSYICLRGIYQRTMSAFVPLSFFSFSFFLFCHGAGDVRGGQIVSFAYKQKQTSYFNRPTQIWKYKQKKP